MRISPNQWGFRLSGFEGLGKLDFLPRASTLQARMTAGNNLVIGPWLVCLQKQPHVNVLP